MVRKKGLIVYGTTQTERKVDIRFREEKDYSYICSKYGFINKAWTEIIHNQNLPKNIPIMIKLKVQEIFSGQEIQISFLGNSFFNLFDTNQVIKIK